MANTIRLRRSSTAGNTPSSLQDGEVAIQQADGIFFWRDSASAVRRMLFPKRSPVSDAAYTIKATDTYIAISSLTTGRSFALPPASAYAPGQVLKIWDESGSCGASAPVTLTPSGSDTINATTSYVIQNPYAIVLLSSDGSSKWRAINLLGIGGDASKATVQPTLTSAISRLLSDRAGDVVNVRDFGAIGNGSADDTAKIQAAANAAIATGKALYFPAGLYLISSTIRLSGVMNIYGDGEGTTTVVTTANDAVFTWDFGTSGGENFSMQDMRLLGQYSSGAATSSSAGITFTGSGYIQYGRFKNLTVQSLNYGFVNNVSTRVTSFGNENNMNWIAWDNINLRAGSITMTYGWFSAKGSGTGNTFVHIKSGGVTGSVLRFQANSLNSSDTVVVGDIVVLSGHFGSVDSVISVGPNTNYRSNIGIVGSQLDAGVNRPFDFDTDISSVRFARILYMGNNSGGGVDITLNLPPLVNSVIQDQLVSESSAGQYWQGNVTAMSGSNYYTAAVVSVTILPYQLAAGSGAWSATVLDLTAVGVAAGLGAIASFAKYAINLNNGTVTVTQLQATQKNSNGLDFTYSISGSTVKFFLLFPQSASGASYADVQARCRGGTHVLKRISS